MRLASNRMLGGILLISGTTIGAGMLAMPISTAVCGFFPSLTLLFICWFFMLASAFFFLDVNLVIRGEPNLISMASKTLGIFGKVLCWIFYLLLLYSLTAAYIAGCSSLFIDGIEALLGYRIPSTLSLFCLPLVFGGFVYLGTKGVDYLNRFLMIGFIVAYLLLVGFIPPYVDTTHFSFQQWPSMFVGLTVIVTSFGYHIIIPSLTTYMDHDGKKLRWTIFIGSAIPLVVYVLWQYLIVGAVPHENLIAAWQQGEPATIPLSDIVKNTTVITAARFFSFFAIVTSFLGVTLSLSDFLVDGFRIKKTWEGKLMASALTFLPPLLFVFTYERGFYLALQYAGAFVAILLIFLPAAMAWKLHGHKFYHTFIGRVTLLIVMLFAFFVVGFDFFQNFSWLRS